MSRNADLEPLNVFELISDPSEKMKILYDLVKAKQDVVVKPSEIEDDIHVLEPRLVQGSELLCKADPQNDVKLKSGSMIMQFQVNAQKYISLVPFRKAGEFISLSMEKKMFRVQRREFFRLKMPQNFRGTMLVPELFGRPFGKVFRLVDLSGGGCKVDLPPMDLDIKPGTVFKGILKLQGRQDFTIICTVRHQSKLTERNDDRWLGLEFFHQSEPEKNRMAATVMDLYRELFKKL